MMNTDRDKIKKAEQILNQNIHSQFIGIETLSLLVGMAPTQLKRNFKLMHGRTIFQYFRQKQMEYAQSLLVKKNYTIKDIAILCGYENSSKFTAAFKKHLGMLPSKIK